MAVVFEVFEMAERSDGCSGETLLSPVQGRRGCRERSVKTATERFSNGGFPLFAETTRSELTSTRYLAEQFPVIA